MCKPFILKCVGTTIRSHLPLMLELGRYRRPKVPCSETICAICSSDVEDKIHFILRCPQLVNTRKPLLEKSIELLEDFQTLNKQATGFRVQKTCPHKFQITVTALVFM